MKTVQTTVSLLLCGYLCACCCFVSNSQNISVDTHIPSTAVKGDFDGDGIQEYAWLITPQFTSDSMNCVGKCISYIIFSNKRLQRIAVDSCIGGTPVNLGDLNDNGSDEIGLLPEWFTSCWRSYLVYTYKKGEWIYAVAPFPVHCNTAEEGLPLIKKDIAKKGNVIIRYSENVEGADIVTKTKSVPVN